MDERLLLVEVPGRVESLARVSAALSFSADGRSAALELPGASGLTLRGEVLSLPALLLDVEAGCVAGHIGRTVRFRALADYAVPHGPGVLGAALGGQCLSGSDGAHGACVAPDLVLLSAAARGEAPAHGWMRHPPRIATSTFPHLRVLPETVGRPQASEGSSERASPASPAALASLDARMPVGDGRQRRGAAAAPWARAFGDAVPGTPDPERLAAAQARFPEALAQIAELFAQRPAWLRSVVARHMGAGLLNSAELQDLLPNVAYFVRDGPWRCCWVRLGYNPADVRNATEASRLQSVELRSARSQVRAHAVSAPLRRAAAYAPDPGVFDGTCPIALSGQFQVCDITYGPVQDLVSSARLQASCAKIDGWLPSGTLEAVRGLVRRRWTELASAVDPHYADAGTVSPMMRDDISAVPSVESMAPPGAPQDAILSAAITADRSVTQLEDLIGVDAFDIYDADDDDDAV